MGYLAVWKVLEEMYMEFQQRGLVIPSTVLTDLKSARVMITIGEADTSQGDTAPQIEDYMGKVESYLVTEAQKRFEPKYIDEWLRRLDEASHETCETCEPEEPRFIAGVPRDQKWVRVEPKDELTFEKIQQFVEQTGVSSREEEDGHLLVFGKAECIKEFIKKLTTFETVNRNVKNADN